MNHLNHPTATESLRSSIAAAMLALAAPMAGALAADDLRLINTAPGWGTLPLAVARVGQPFDVRNQGDAMLAQFAQWAATPGVQVLEGDFNNDGRRDLALLNRNPLVGWQSMPVAYANADGTFRIENRDIGRFAGLAAQSDVDVITGDFNGDGRTDVSLVKRGYAAKVLEGQKWTGAPLLLTQGDGSFVNAQWNLGSFAGWATASGFGTGFPEGPPPRPNVVTGDFNGDGLTDIALVYPCGAWTTIPVAYAVPGGGFRIENHPAVGLQQPCLSNQALAGDFNGDGKTDLASITSGGIVVAQATGTGFVITAPFAGTTFEQMAKSAPVTILLGKFDTGPTTDITLVPNNSWNSVLIAFGNSGATGSQFTVRDMQVPEFATWATQGAVPVVGDFDGNGQADIALIPKPRISSDNSLHWASIPIAYSHMQVVIPPCILNPKPYCPPPVTAVPALRVDNQAAPAFVDWARVTSVKALTGDFGR